MSQQIFNEKTRYRTYETEAKAMLILLGFGTVVEFGHQSGTSHMTAGEIIGTFTLNRRKQHDILIRAHETLHSAYVLRKADMPKAMRRYVCDWAKRWRKFAVNDLLWLESPGKTLETTGAVERKRTKGRRAAVKLAVMQAFEALKWEA